MSYFDNLTFNLTAARLRIDNSPHCSNIETRLDSLIDNLIYPFSLSYAKPFLIVNGYVSPKLQPVVRMPRSSQHLKGYACDISAGTKFENQIIFEILSKMDYDILAIVGDYKQIHVSYRQGNNRNKIIRL